MLEKMEKIETELITLRSHKIENEAKISYQDERIKSLSIEIDSKNK